MKKAANRRAPDSSHHYFNIFMLPSPVIHETSAAPYSNSSMAGIRITSRLLKMKLPLLSEIASQFFPLSFIGVCGPTTADSPLLLQETQSNRSLNLVWVLFCPLLQDIMP